MPAKMMTKTERKLQRQEELREKLQGLEYLRQINNAVEAVVGKEATIEPNELAAHKFVVDTNFRRLAKILPDIKEAQVKVEGKVEHVSKRVSEQTREILGEFTRIGDDTGPETPLQN